MDWEANQKWLKRLIRVKCQQCVAKMDTWDFPGFSHIFVQGQRHGESERGREAGGRVDGCASFLKLECCLPAPVALLCVCVGVWVCVCVRSHTFRVTQSDTAALHSSSSYLTPALPGRPSAYVVNDFWNDSRTNCACLDPYMMWLGRQPSFIY